MVIDTRASDAAPQENHNLHWLHTEYDGGPIRREDIGDVFLSMDADSKTLTWQQAHQLASVAHGIVKAHGNYRYSAGYRHGLDSGKREHTPDELAARNQGVADALRAVLRDAGKVGAVGASVARVAESYGITL